jgi:hypothetical protein
MAKFKMKYFGGINGIVSKRYYSFSKYEIIEAEEGEFHSSDAEELKEAPKKEVVKPTTQKTKRKRK